MHAEKRGYLFLQGQHYRPVTQVAKDPTTGKTIADKTLFSTDDYETANKVIALCQNEAKVRACFDVFNLCAAADEVAVGDQGAVVQRHACRVHLRHRFRNSPDGFIVHGQFQSRLLIK